VFDAVEGREPVRPWSEPELARVLAMLTELSEALTPARTLVTSAVEQIGLRRPRLGGWSRVAADADQFLQLAEVSPWAAEHLGRLCHLEGRGVSAAEGVSLVHFDLHPRNILMNDDRVLAVDWAFARLGNPLVDLVTLLSSVAADGADPDPHAVAHPLAADADPGVLDALIAAHAGFCITASLQPAAPRRQPILDVKRALGLGALAWLEGRLGR
jgi:Ser/Thr protein kinase RdoA (MazF antagonist)